MSDSEAIERRVFAILEASGNPYKVHRCDPSIADTAEFCDHYGISPGKSGNILIVVSKKEPKHYAACCVLATTRVDVNHTVRSLMGGRRLSFASADETVSVTGMMVGGVTPFGLPAELPFFVDSRVMECDTVVFGGGSRSCKIEAPPEVLKSLPGMTLVEGLAVPRR